MALNKSFMTQWGIEASYWNIGEYNASYFNRSAGIVLYGYASPQKGKILDVRFCPISLIGENDIIQDFTREQLYARVKQLPEWTDAEDC